MNFTDLSPLSSSSSDVPSPLAPDDAPSVWRRSRAPRPPRGFNLIRGGARNVHFAATRPPFATGQTWAQKAGLRYEQKVVDVLSAVYGDRFVAAPVIQFTDNSGPRRAIPDGVLRLDRTTLVIVEVKLTHTERAWWQLERLYAPLIAALNPGATLLRCEITRSFDPVVPFPTLPVVVKSLHALPPHCVGVLQWKL